MSVSNNDGVHINIYLNIPYDWLLKISYKHIVVYCLNHKKIIQRHKVACNYYAKCLKYI